jgi:hypothetical protein
MSDVDQIILQYTNQYRLQTIASVINKKYVLNLLKKYLTISIKSTTNPHMTLNDINVLTYW